MGNEAETRLRALDQTRNTIQIDSKRRSEKEQQLAAEIEACAPPKPSKLDAWKAEARLREHDGARQAAARVRELSEEEQRIGEEIERLARLETEHLSRIKETEDARSRRGGATGWKLSPTPRPTEEVQRLKQLRPSVRSKVEAVQRAEHEPDWKSSLCKPKIRTQTAPRQTWKRRRLKLRNTPNARNIERGNRIAATSRIASRFAISEAAGTLSNLSITLSPSHYPI
jgi:hypothetical protein